MPGDLAGIARLQAKLQGLVGAKDRLVRVLAEEAITQTRMGFRESRDPYGNAWKPLAMRVGGKPLDDTGTHLKGRITVLAQDADSFRIGTNFIGARLHQYGGTIVPKRARALRFGGYTKKGTRGGATVFARRAVIPARPYLPDARGLGPIWGPAIRSAATRFVSRLLQA